MESEAGLCKPFKSRFRFPHEYSLGIVHYVTNTDRRCPISRNNTRGISQTPSTGLRHPSFKEGAGKRCSECDAVRFLSCCFTSTETIRNGESRTATSTFDFHTVHELWHYVWSSALSSSLIQKWLPTWASSVVILMFIHHWTVKLAAASVTLHVLVTSVFSVVSPSLNDSILMKVLQLQTLPIIIREWSWRERKTNRILMNKNRFFLFAEHIRFRINNYKI